MQANIIITVHVMTDGGQEDLEAIASQLNMTISDDFELIRDDLNDKEPILTVKESETQILQ